MMHTELKILDLDQERIKSLESNNGFVVDVKTHTSTNELLKDTISKGLYGTLGNPENYDLQQYKCMCGKKTGKMYVGVKCSECNTEVVYVGENLNYFGWIILEEDCYINPQMYQIIKGFIGEPTLLDILKPYGDGIDINGAKNNQNSNRKPKSKFSGIGMKRFEKDFDEIMDHFLKSKKNKKDVYEFIINNKHLIFTHSYPIYTIHLRPITINNKQCEYHIMNEKFAELSKTSSYINDNIASFNNLYAKNELLFKFQTICNDIYMYIAKNVFPDKFGAIKKIISGRCNLTSRNVIIPNPNLNVDEVIISYYSAVKVFEQLIINFLYNNVYADMNSARVRWQQACCKKDPLIESIIKDIIANYRGGNGRGFPVIVNRNPTIAFGGIMAMYVVGINDSYALEISLLICKTTGADFDGDKFNILWSMYDPFTEKVQEIFNPRNNMFISKNNGKFNKAFSPTDDIMLNLNTIHDMYNSYTEEEYMHNMAVKEKKIS